MTKGYQIIELADLDSLVSNASCEHVSVVMLDWLVSQLKKELGEKMTRAQIEVVPVDYHGFYPAIGVHYLGSDSADLEPDIQRAATKILRSTNVADLVLGIAALTNSTSDRLAQLKGLGKSGG